MQLIFCIFSYCLSHTTGQHTVFARNAILVFPNISHILLPAATHLCTYKF